MGKYMVGLQLMVIGMGTVLLSLILLSLFLRATGNVFGGEKKKGKKEKNIKDKKSANNLNVKKEVNSTEVEVKNHDKKIAAVAAAVYKVLDKNKNYRIISIQKSQNSWKR